MNILIKWIKAPKAKKSLSCEAIIFLGLARIALLFFPFRILARHLGQQNVELRSTNIHDTQSVRSVRWAILKTSSFVPWRSDCLPQAFAAVFMLRRRHIPYQLNLGVLKNENNTLDAHAWVITSNQVVTGDVDKNYPVISSFCWDSRSAK